MTLQSECGPQAFVLLRLGDRRFAVASSQIAELVAPSRLFRFPHRSAAVEGVILRRGRIVPAAGADRRSTAMVQFPGGYIAEIHAQQK